MPYCILQYALRQYYFTLYEGSRVFTRIFITLHKLNLCWRKTSPFCSSEVLVFDFRPLTCLYSRTRVIVKCRAREGIRDAAQKSRCAGMGGDAAKERKPRSLAVLAPLRSLLRIGLQTRLRKITHNERRAANSLGARAAGYPIRSD